MKLIVLVFLMVLTHLSIAQKKHWINTLGENVKKDVATNYYTLSKTEAKTFIYNNYAKLTDSLVEEINYPTKERLSKEGEFKRYFENGKLAVEGSYLNDLKTGVWKVYFETGVLTKTTTFKAGIKEDEQVDYKNGEIEAIYRYKNDELNSIIQLFDTDGVSIFKEDTSDIAIYTFVDQEAEFPGGEKELALFFKQFETNAKEIVYLSYNIDSQGKVTEAELNKLTNSTVSEEDIKQALKLIATMPKWEPAMKRGRVVKSREEVVLGSKNN